LGLGRSPCWPSGGREPDRPHVRCGVDPIRPALAVLEDLQFWKNGIASSERLDQAALLSAPDQLDPSAGHRERLRTYLALRRQGALGEEL
jgi:hypothetical protein